MPKSVLITVALVGFIALVSINECSKKSETAKTDPVDEHECWLKDLLVSINTKPLNNNSHILSYDREELINSEAENIAPTEKYNVTVESGDYGGILTVQKEDKIKKIVIKDTTDHVPKSILKQFLPHILVSINAENDEDSTTNHINFSLKDSILLMDNLIMFRINRKESPSLSFTEFEKTVFFIRSHEFDNQGNEYLYRVRFDQIKFHDYSSKATEDDHFEFYLKK